MKKASLQIIITCLLFIITGCTHKSPSTDRINAHEKQTTNVPNSVKLDVIYIPQNDAKSCATTAMAMAISYYEHLNDKPLDKETVWKISGTDENAVHQYGNDMNGLKKIADYYGYKSEYIENMKISDLENLLSKGTLVIINIKTSKEGPATHALLVVGYNKNKKTLYVKDPGNSQHTELEYSDLETRWSAHLNSPRGNSLCSGFVIYPKNPGQ